MEAEKRPSTWFVWHQRLVKSGDQVLDIACAAGRHAIAAAEVGADVVAIDHDPKRIETGRKIALAHGLSITWQRADLTVLPLPESVFDVVMGFNYLDRNRMEDFKKAVKPGGLFIYETFRRCQSQFDWGPTSPDHLLENGELISLVEPFEILFAREVLEAVDSKSAVVASVVAARRK